MGVNGGEVGSANEAAVQLFARVLSLVTTGTEWLLVVRRYVPRETTLKAFHLTQALRPGA